VQILVNNSPFDVTIEKESSLGEVVAAISEWLADNNFSITGITVDEDTFDPFNNEEWQGLSIDSVNTLNLSALSVLELRTAHISTLFDYVTLFRDALASGNREVIAQLIEEYPPVRGALDKLINPGSEGTPLSNRLDQLLTMAGIIDGRPGPQVRALLEFFRNLEVIIQDRLDEVQAPVKELKKVIETLDQLVPVLEELPVLLQTGKDNEAMQHIITFTELTGKLTRLIPYVRLQTGIDIAGGSDAGTFEQLYLELNPVLAELTEAFSSLDAVLIGDLVEYEIAPRIGSICTEIRSRLAESGESP
jgi:hypothetical protein